MSSGRIAGDNPNYTWALSREVPSMPTAADILAGRKTTTLVPTEHTFELISVSSFLGDVMGKPAGAMAYWGFRGALTGVAAVLDEAPEDLFGLNAEQLEEFLKARGVSPSISLETAGDRGHAAHEILEMLAAGERIEADHASDRETAEFGTEYGKGVIDWWDARVAPHLESGAITEVRSEVPVWSLLHKFMGTFDLALRWEGHAQWGAGWEILDLKTHKPARGFTLPFKGPGYVSEAAQIRAYRMAWEEMGLGKTIGQRTVIAREKTVRGHSWLEDDREVPADMVIQIRKAYDHKLAFEGGKGDE